MSVASALHVFVCYNALSYEASLRIFAGLRQADEATEGAFLLMFDADDARLPERVRCFRLSPPMEAYSRWTKAFRIAAWFETVKASLFGEGHRPLHVYVAHPLELPGNHFLFYKRPGDRVDLLPDGLSNYIHVSMKPERLSAWPRYITRVILEVLAARLHGFRYMPVVGGHQTQYETGLYDAIWTFNPTGYLTRVGELEVVPRGERLAIARTPGPPAVLFLDQELHAWVDAEAEAEMRATVTRTLLSRSPQRVLYKAHPRGRNRIATLRAEGLAVEDVSARVPAERLLETHDVSTVIGFFSTTLVLLSPSEVAERVAVLPEPGSRGILRPRTLDRARAALGAAGVQLVASRST